MEEKNKIMMKCPMCGMEFSGDTEEEVKEKMKMHSMEAHKK